jgi:hypothetical protein
MPASSCFGSRSKLKQNAARGVDALTWQDYEADLEPGLVDLHARVQPGAYRRCHRGDGIYRS